MSSPVGARVVDDEAAPFHRHGRVGLLVDRLAHHVGGGGEHVVERRRRAGPPISPMTFEPWLSCTSASASSAVGVVDDRRQRLVVDVDQLGRVLGEVRLSATTSATGSPTKRTSSSASGGRGVSGLAGPIEVCHCSLTSRVEVGGGEHGVHAGRARAPPRCRSRGSRARANGLRTKRRVQHPGQRDVVDVGAVPGEQPGVLDAVDARPDVPGGAGRVLRRSRELRGPAAVDRDDRTAHERRAVRREERGDLRDLVRLPAAVQRRLLEDAGMSSRGVHP